MSDSNPRSGSDSDPRPYRDGVGAVVFNDHGLVFVAERADTPGAWQFPQGGLDAGEDPRRAVLRELAEEIGTSRVRILAETEDWLSYDLPAALRERAWRGRFRGQRQKWFAVQFEGAEADIRLDAETPAEFVRWRWQPLADVPALIVDFKRPLYEALVQRFAGFAGRQMRPGA